MYKQVKKKIMIVIGGLYPGIKGGKEKQAFQLASHLSLKHDVSILTRYNKNNISKETNYSLIEKRIPDVPVFRFFYDMFMCILELTKHRNSIDVLFCYGIGNDSLKGLLFKKLFNIPFIISIRSHYELLSFTKVGASKSIFPSFWRALIKLLVYESKFIHAQTESMKKELNKYLPLK